MLSPLASVIGTVLLDVIMGCAVLYGFSIIAHDWRVMLRDQHEPE